MSEQMALEDTYDSTMSVYERRFVTREAKQVEEEILVYQDFPCAISRVRAGSLKANQPVSQSLLGELKYENKIFTAPHLTIKAGSRITVTQYGKTISFVSCGEPLLYLTHQEILVSRDDYV
ncbi:MAG: hypothetical protein RR977_00980 [Oscillospiraceae bacterium]